MFVWRICKLQHAAKALSGEGGLYASGRWHYKGSLVVYTSATLSLSTLETLVHTSPDLLPDDLVSSKIEIPDNLTIERLDITSLPPGWRDVPPPIETQDLGKNWLDAVSSVALEVPSAVVDDERNYLLNPKHSEITQVKIVSVSPIYDQRLMKK